MANCDKCGKDTDNFNIQEVVDTDDILCFECFVKSLEQIPSCSKQVGEILKGGNPYGSK